MYEIIVVDNDSRDGTREFLEGQEAVVKVYLSFNAGTVALNSAFQVAKGDYLLVLNDDSAPEKDALIKFSRRLQTSGERGIFACKIVNPLNNHNYCKM